MRVTVTGGAGFIGHHLVGRLVGLGHDVTVLDNLHRGSFERPGLLGSRCVEGDVRWLEDCASAFEGADAVVHLAAQSNVMGSQSDPDYTYATNVAGTWNVVRAAAKASARHLIFASSREVYGNARCLPVAETAPLAPHNLYGASKVAGEVLVSSLPEASPGTSILRLANVVGPGDSGRVVPLWLTNARCGAPLTVFGGAQTLDLVPVAFVCDVLARVLEVGPLPGPINVGSGSGTPILELAGRITSLTNSSSTIEVVAARDVEVTHFRADVRRMQRELGLEPPADPLAAIEADW
jgi:UDP-glucose 4-epimerase